MSKDKLFIIVASKSVLNAQRKSNARFQGRKKGLKKTYLNAVTMLKKKGFIK